MRTRSIAVVGAAFLAAALAIPGSLLAAGASPLEDVSESLPAPVKPERLAGTVEKAARGIGKKGLETLKGGRDAVPNASRDDDRKVPRSVQAAVSPAAAAAVDIRDFSYRPKTITVSVGDTVTWTNSDQAPHDADAFDGSFDTPVLDQGESASVTFDQPGSFDYFCSVHPPEDFPEFTGTVEVAAADDGTDSGTGGGDEPVSSDAGSGDGQSSTGATEDAGTEAAGNKGATQAGSSARKGALASTGQDLLAPAIAGAILLAGGLLIRRRAQSP